MSCNPLKHDRRSIRLPGWDYTRSGTYFVTLCTYRNRCAFGEVVAGRMFLNRWGKIAREEWLRSAEIRREISLDAYVIMPNHLHGIVIIRRPSSRLRVTWPGHESGEKHRIRSSALRIEWPWTPKCQSLHSFITGFKAGVTGRINRARRTPDGKVWQRSYWDRGLRSERECSAARQYIRDNPSLWHRDRNHPDRL